jgi:hypothetical protein
VGVRLAELVAALSMATDLGLGQPQEHVLRQTVDPRRDVREYLDDAAAAGLRIEYVIETHVSDLIGGYQAWAAA